MDGSSVSASDLSTLKALVPLAVPAIKSAIDTWLVPAVQVLLKSKKVAASEDIETIKKQFEEYLLRMYAKLSFVNTIVFGNQQRRIQDLYLPLTVRCSAASEKSLKIDKWRDDFIPHFKRVVVTDTAGMGKSTLLKWLFLCSLGNAKSIPIFIEMRTLSSGKKILDKIYEDLCPIDKVFDKDVLVHLIKQGKFVFFLDGFDEVAFEDRVDVVEDVQSFIAKAFDNLFVLASRHETALASFGDFREFSIKPLSKEEAYELLRKYDSSGEHAEALIRELKTPKYIPLRELMTNPMLVSLLYKAYSYKPQVPFKKQIFYRQVFDALFDMHDSTKGGAFVRQKHSNLDIDDFHLIMRDVGFTTAKLGKIEYETDQICTIVKNVRERNTAVLFPPAALLKDLVTTVPLFNKEGNHYKWAHKSIQDYFASQYIALDSKGNEEKLLAAIYERGHCARFENILDMLHDSDNKMFRRVLLRRMLLDYVKHYASLFRTPVEGVSQELIEERKELMFGAFYVIHLISGKDLSKVVSSVQRKEYSSLFPNAVPPERLMLYRTGAESIIVASSSMRSFGLLRLVANRGYPFVVRSPQRVHPKKGVKEWGAKGTFMVDDDPESPLNSPNNFKKTNSILAEFGYRLSIKDVRRVLAAIESEDELSTQSDHMLDNL